MPGINWRIGLRAICLILFILVTPNFSIVYATNNSESSLLNSLEDLVASPSVLNISMRHEEKYVLIVHISNVGNRTVEGKVWGSMTPLWCIDYYSIENNEIYINPGDETNVTVEFSPNSISSQEFPNEYNGDFTIRVYFSPTNKSLPNSTLTIVNVHVENAPEPIHRLSTGETIGIVLVAIVGTGTLIFALKVRKRA